MQVIYEHKLAMTLIGFLTTIRPGEGYVKCPEFWNKEYAQKSARLFKTMVPETPIEPTIITYGSQYGSAEHYARKFAECTDFPVLPYREAKCLSDYARVIHFGALYAGGVLGLRPIVSLLSPKAELFILTVGLADVQDAENIRNIRSAIRRQIPEDIFQRVQIFHLRGAIDYGKLNLKHRTMMTLLYAKAKGLPEEKKNAETQAMIETYGKQVSFVDDTAVVELINSICQKQIISI